MGIIQILGARAERMFPEIIEDIREKNCEGHRCYFVVPAQFAIQAEKAMLHVIPALLDIDVLSPQRLQRLVFENSPVCPMKQAGDLGKALSAAMAVWEAQRKKKITYFTNAAKSMTFPQEMAMTIEELSQAGVIPDQLMNHDSDDDDASGSKEADIGTIWNEYNSIMQEKYLSPQEYEDELLARIPMCGLFEESYVWVYGFEVLQGDFCRFLKKIAMTAEKVQITMTMDRENAPDGDIFITQRNSALRMMGIANSISAIDESVPCSINYMDEMPLRATKAMQTLEKNLFASSDEPCTDDMPGICLCQAADPFQEANFIVSRLRQWHDVEHIDWDKIAIFVADKSSIETVLVSTLKQASIPIDYDDKNDVKLNCVFRFALYSLRCAAFNFSAADVMELLHTKMTHLSDNAEFELESYARENGIDRGKWTVPFSKGNFAKAEKYRKALINPIIDLKNQLLMSMTTSEMIVSIRRYLLNCGIAEAFVCHFRKIVDSGESTLAEKERQIWTKLNSVLDEMELLLDGSKKKISLKELTYYFAVGISSVTINPLPSNANSVSIGEAGHMMLANIEAAVVCGLQDGIMDTSSTELLTRAEKNSVAARAKTKIGFAPKELSALRQTDFYRTIATPRSHLALTCSLGKIDGANLQPAGFLTGIISAFPGIEIYSSAAPSQQTVPLMTDLVEDELPLILRMVSDGQTEISEELLAEMKKAAQRDFFQNNEPEIERNVLDIKFPEELPQNLVSVIYRGEDLSITRLEKFAECPFKHFVEYGIKPKENKEFVYESTDKGTFFHRVMQNYTSIAMNDGKWPNVPDEVIDDYITKAMEPLVKEWQDSPLDQDNTSRQTAQEYIRYIKRAMKACTMQMQNSRFGVFGREVEFGSGKDLPPLMLDIGNGKQVKVQGKIDRIDRYDSPEESYVRVIDYKSSDRTLTTEQTWNGFQLQLIMYLDAISSDHEQMVPSGAFYFIVKDPMVDADENSDECSRKLMKELQLKGYVLAEPKVVSAMDSEETDFSISRVLTKENVPDKTGPGLTREQMKQLIAHTHHEAEKLAGRICSGEIEIDPAEGQGWDSCKYCRYAGICGFDVRDYNCRRRKVTSVGKMDNLRQLLQDEMAAKKQEGKSKPE